MIEEHWRRIAGLEVRQDGTMAAVWLAHDWDTDVVHLYDACTFKSEVLAVVAEGLNARGRWIPVAWSKGAKEIADRLLDKGCGVLHEPVDSSQELAEAVSLDIWERMRSRRFRVDKRLGEWLEEFRSFDRAQGKVPIGTHPLMAATRYAISMLDYAIRQRPAGKAPKRYPEVAIV